MTTASVFGDPAPDGVDVDFGSIFDEHGWDPKQNLHREALAAAAGLRLKRVGVRFLDLNEGAGTQNILDLSDTQVTGLKSELDDMGFGVNEICSGFGKAPLEAGQEGSIHPHDEWIRNVAGPAFDRLACLEAPWRVFPGYGPAALSEQFMGALSEAAKRKGARLLFENECNFVFATAKALAEKLAQMGDHVGIVFDAGNDVLVLGSTAAVVNDYNAARAFIKAQHIKDYRLELGYTPPTETLQIKEDTLCRFTPCGLGHGGYPQILPLFAADIPTIRSQGWRPFLDVEGHGTGGGHRRGWTDPRVSPHYVSCAVAQIRRAGMNPTLLSEADFLAILVEKLKRSNLKDEPGWGM